VIDLHTHSTASDGRCTPRELVGRAVAVGVRTLGLTDHDTVAGCAEAQSACVEAGVQFVPGIEVTTIVGGSAIPKDVHVLGYFIDAAAPSLLSFLAEQRARRLDRVREIVEQLASFGIALDIDAILKPGLEDTGKAAGRPWIARALVEGGHVASTAEAFDLWLGRGSPAYVPRVGPTPSEAFGQIHDAGGLVSLAHPGLTAIDPMIPALVDVGLDAIEAYHSKHAWLATQRYLRLAGELNLLTTGGSDFHGQSSHGPAAPGSVVLPRDAFERLVNRVRRS
jgi:predicted metal-dependent phosphoesterase TrpH